MLDSIDLALSALRALRIEKGRLWFGYRRFHPASRLRFEPDSLVVVGNAECRLAWDRYAVEPGEAPSGGWRLIDTRFVDQKYSYWQVRVQTPGDVPGVAAGLRGRLAPAIPRFSGAGRAEAGPVGRAGTGDGECPPASGLAPVQGDGRPGRAVARGPGPALRRPQ